MDTVGLSQRMPFAKTFNTSPTSLFYAASGFQPQRLTVFNNVVYFSDPLHGIDYVPTGGGDTCSGGVCGNPCANGVQDGDETDVDCGGSCGATCDIGRYCSWDGDCIDWYCDGGQCW